MTKKVRSFFLIPIGVLSIILAIVCFSMDRGSYTSREYYGGDAYTGMQQAAAQTANNVLYLSDIVQAGCSSILLVGGLSLVVCGIPVKREQEAYNVSVPADPATDKPDFDELPDL